LIKIENVSLFTVREIGTELGVTDVTIRNYINQGKLKAKQVFGRWLITEEEKNKFFASLHQGESHE